MNLRHLYSSLVALAAFSIALAISTHAQTWTGAGDGSSWNDPNNWTPVGVPVSTAGATIDSVNGPVISSGLVNINSLSMGISNNFSLSSTGALTVQGSGSLVAGTGNLRVASGSAGVGNLTITDNAYFATNAASICFGYNGMAYVTMSGNALIETFGANYVLFGERAGSGGHVVVSDSATWNITSSQASALNIGYATSNPAGGYLLIQDSAKVNLVNGGVDLGRGATSSGTLKLSSTVAGDRATLSTKTGIQAAGGLHANTHLIFDGGVLRALSGTTAFIRNNITITTEGQGAFIDSNGFDIGIANTVMITGNGSFTKQGGGALTLNTTAANTTYTGATSVERGSLVIPLANLLATSSTINIAATGTLIAANRTQTLQNLSGAGSVVLSTGTAFLAGSGSSDFSGNLYAATIIKNGTGRVTLSGSNNITNSSTLAAGILGIGHANALGDASNKLIMTGGTLQTTANFTMLNDIQVATGPFNVSSDSRTTIASTITGAAGIHKTDIGDAILSGDLSGLAGNITVSQGGLFTGNYTASVTVAGGAAFGGSGTITGNISFSSGTGFLQAGYTHNDLATSSASSLTIDGNVNFLGDAVLRIDMFNSGADTIIARDATFAGSGNRIDLTNVQTGTFTIFTLTSGTFADTSFAITQNNGEALSVRTTATYAFSDDKKSLLLDTLKNNFAITWGGGNGVWDTTSAIWQSEDDKFDSGDKVTFADATPPSGSYQITIEPDIVRVSELHITDGSYNFTGGSIVVDKNSAGTTGTSFQGEAPDGTFTINTTGMVFLHNDSANTFTEGINLVQGTLSGNVMTFGDANIANNDKVVFNQDVDATYTGAMTGTGTLIKTNTASLTVGNNLSGFGGITELQGGTFIIADSSTYNSSIIGNSGNVRLEIGNNVTIAASTSLLNGAVTIGDNSRTGAISINTGTGGITLGSGGTINGNASTYDGHIVLGANSIIAGSVSTDYGGVFLNPESRIDGSVTAFSTLIQLMHGSKINGSVTITGGGNAFLSTRVLVTTTNISTGIVTVTGTTWEPPSQIGGDVIIAGSAPRIIGEGIIGGTLHLTDPAADAWIWSTQVTQTGLGGFSFPTGTTSPTDSTLEIGNIVLAGGATIEGSGTLKTNSITFNDDLILRNDLAATGTNAYLGGFVITGSLVSTGSAPVIKTGIHNVIISAPSSYSGNTYVEQGSLVAGAASALSPTSAFYIRPGASLGAGGFDQTLSFVANDGRLYIGPNGRRVAGAKVRVTGPYISGYGSSISFNIIAGDSGVISDQLIFANATSVSGEPSRILVQFHEGRSEWLRVIQDITPLIIAESGTFTPGRFILDDGLGAQRVVMSQRDYVLEYTDRGIELVATHAAEMPAALAANALSLIVNNASLGSVSQRLDYIRAADSLPGGENTTIQTWAQNFHLSETIDGDLFPDTEGTAKGFQVGIDKRSKKAGEAYTIMGLFMDYTDATADLPSSISTINTSADLTSTGLGAYIAARFASNWRTDLAARYSWDKYNIHVGRAQMDTDGYSWSLMLRTLYAASIGKNWTFTPQAQVIYQNRIVRDATDDHDRSYVFGPESMRLNQPSSFESRIGIGLRKLIVVTDTISLAPYLNANFNYEFKGSLAITTVGMVPVREDFGGSSLHFTVGLPVRLTKRIDAYADATLRTGGPATGHGFNLGINYRW